MARPTIEDSDTIEVLGDPMQNQQTPETGTEPDTIESQGQNSRNTRRTLERPNRRVSYAVGDPNSAPELVRLMNCRTIQDIEAIPSATLVAAALQARNTVAEWEGTITESLERINELQKQNDEQRTILEYLERQRIPSMTPSPTTTKSTKIPDPERLSNGQNPTYENWKTQIEGKFTTNHDHFATEQAKMVYLFNRTTGDAQAHLQPRFGDDVEDPFQNAKEMIQHLSTIYQDPYKVQNKRQEYRRLTMKPSQTFTDFYTNFLHLAGIGKIPLEDWRPDLYDKLTVELQRAVLPVLATLPTYQTLAEQCRLLDQELRRIRERTDRIKARTATTPRTTNIRTSNYAITAPTPTTKALNIANTTTSTGMTKLRPIYDNLKRQALSRAGACFTCHQPGHMAKECPLNPDMKVIEKDTDESGKEEP
jgi:Zinc knuckle